MARFRGNDLLIARNRAGGELRLTALQRSMHLYAVGSTGSGKSKFLEYLIRQDIENWQKSECELLLLDPHGAIYDGVMEWLASTSYIYERPIIPIDLRRDDWVVAYNLLRERVAASVVTDNLVRHYDKWLEAEAKGEDWQVYGVGTSILDSLKSLTLKNAI